MGDSNSSADIGSSSLPTVVNNPSVDKAKEVKVNGEKPPKRQRTRRGSRRKPSAENETAVLAATIAATATLLVDEHKKKNSKKKQIVAPVPDRCSPSISQQDLKTRITQIKGKLSKYSRKQGGTVQPPADGDQQTNRKRRSNSERTNDIRDVPRLGSVSVLAKSSQPGRQTRSLSESHAAVPHESAGKKTEPTKAGKKNRNEVSTKEQPVGQTDAGNVNFDSLSFFLLDLLLLPPDKRETLIIKEACSRGLLFEDKHSWHLNPKIVSWRDDGPFRQKYKTIPETVKTLAGKKFASIPADLKQTFEYFVNTVVHQGLADVQREKFTFPTTKWSQQTKNYFKAPPFEEQLEAFARKCVQADLGVIVEAEVRVSSKNNGHAFMKVSDNDRDAMFSSQLLRKYALHGDIVRAFVRNVVEDPSRESSDKLEISMDVDSSRCLDVSTEILDDEPLVESKSAKAFVIKIVKEVHNKLAVGTFMSFRKNVPFVTFVPRDMRLPNIRIYEENLRDIIKQGKAEGISDTLYVAEIIEWSNDVCIGRIVQPIGKCGELESENKAILLNNNLKFEPFDEKFNEMYGGDFVIPDEELKRREDLRSECIFTIDPLTAKDLDDAVSVRRLDDGNFEVGVHISDVAYFLDEESELDQLVKNRTTSIYMVNEVFHMLPKPLCFRCSLLPDADKLSFSVFWTMTPQAEVLSTRFARTVMRSCTQLAYQHAQMIIDNPEREFGESDFPQIHNGFKAFDIVNRVKQLNALATVLRDNRFENGSLRIDRPKIYFDLDPKTGAPIAFRQQEQLPANFLIEELMLLANQSVAAFIYEKFPNISILRKHPAPLKNVLKRTKDQLQKAGLNLDVSSAKSIYSSLNRLANEMGNKKSASVCLSQLVSKAMVRAKYFCSDDVSSEEFNHYALAIPIYTHFTSPIRRYPDVLVHRILAAALNYTSAPKRDPAELKSLAERCNDDKYNAKLAGDDSTNLYFLHYVQSKKSIKMMAALVNVYMHSFEAILVETGVMISANLKNGSDVKARVSKENGTCRLFAIYPNTEDKEIELTLCSEVWLELTVKSKKLRATLVAPPSDEELKAGVTVIETAKEEENSAEQNDGNDDTQTSVAKNNDTDNIPLEVSSMLNDDDNLTHPLLKTNNMTPLSDDNISELVKSQSIALAKMLGMKPNNATSSSRSESVSSKSTNQSSIISSSCDEIVKNDGAAYSQNENAVVDITESMERILVAETPELTNTLNANVAANTPERLEDNNDILFEKLTNDERPLQNVPTVNVANTITNN